MPILKGVATVGSLSSAGSPSALAGKARPLQVAERPESLRFSAALSRPELPAWGAGSCGSAELELDGTGGVAGVAAGVVVVAAVAAASR